MPEERTSSLRCGDSLNSYLTVFCF